MDKQYSIKFKSVCFMSLLAIFTFFSAITAFAVDVDENNVAVDSDIQAVSAQPEDIIPNEVEGDAAFIIIFPASGDTRYTQIGTNFWHMGDYVQGIRTFPQAADTVDMVLYITDNVLSCDTQDHVLMIDGDVVGEFSVAAGDTAVNASFIFSQISAGAHTIRIETTRTVISGCGSAGFLNNVSTLDFSSFHYCYQDQYGNQYQFEKDPTDPQGSYLRGQVVMNQGCDEPVWDFLGSYYSGIKFEFTASNPLGDADTACISCFKIKGLKFPNAAWYYPYGYGGQQFRLVKCGTALSDEAPEGTGALK